MKRRRFLVSAAATVAAPAIVRGQNLNSRVQIAGIGCDGKGYSDLSEMHGHQKTKLVAFCDVDLARTQRIAKLSPDAPVFQDFREMLAKQGEKIDAVTVSTPDHMHAFIGIEAMRQGKHCYCQKPLTHNVWEARQMSMLAKQSGLITRLGNQIHSHQFYRTAAHAVQNGAIGKVNEVHSWCSATGHGKSFHIDRPKTNAAIPSTLDWDKWLGVAQERPFGEWKVYHPWGWRDWQDFGNGALGDFGCHILDPVFTALNIKKAPTSITADHSGMNEEVWPAQNTVRYVFPGNEMTVGNTLNVTWYDGGRQPSHRGTGFPSDHAFPKSGSILIGEKATMVIPHVGACYLSNAASLQELPGQNHYHGWVDGILSGEQPSDGFEYGGPLTEAVLLGNVAVRFRGQALQWDGQAMEFPNHPDANRYLKRDYRAGWEITPVAPTVAG
ncbi:Gfo/Idh/MocA family protein [Roseiconus lacunae]|uniref:Gfo/Idh/MocA family protein n=1 Tax=Roseiconus lacunae TaxID=2605694 RepID=UPI0011F10CC6|nr:Gfo/Idh/MocA family oxidoreductase [Roseiconus lacunae]